MLVHEYLKKNKEYLRSKDKAKKFMMYQDIYIIAYVKIQKLDEDHPLYQTYNSTVV